MLKPSLYISFVVALMFFSACSGDDNRPENEEGITPADRTYAIFSPGTSELPVPNDLLFSSETAGDGTMTAGSDPGNPVIEGIDAMDGSSVIAPIDIAFSDSLDASQTLSAQSFVAVGESVIPNPSQNVFLLPLAYPGGDALLQASADLNSDGTPEGVEVPTFAKAAAYQRAVATGDVATLLALAAPDARAELISLDGGTNNVLRISPLQPLMPETKYLIVVTTLQDNAGNDVLSSIAYDYIGDPNSNITPLGLDSLRAAMTGWEQLASGYFAFMQAVYSGAGVSASAPSADDIIFSLTFTTGGTDAVLKSIAAPEVFFEKSIRTGYKQDAIAKLVSGTYNLSGDNSNVTTVTDGAINSTLNFLLTSPVLPDTSPNPLYNETMAAAIDAGASYATLAADSASTAYLLQVAATEAALSVYDSGSAEQGDNNEASINAEAIGTVAAMAAGAEVTVGQLFPLPAPRPTNFYRVDLASEINPALQAPALVYQGEITLPTFLGQADGEDGSALKTSSWQANQTIGGVIDAGRGNDPGTTPPSEMITYRYPFPGTVANQTVPVLVTTPEPSTLAAFDLAKPEAGWPVVIYVHGITADRSNSLPLGDALAFACIAQDLSGPTGAPCFATIAIDQPLHGFTPAGSGVPGLPNVSAPDFAVEPNVPEGSPNMPSDNLSERHFNFTADANLNPVPIDYDAGFGDSGSLFINLTNFRNARDNLRQMAVDLLNLNASISSMDVDGDGIANDLDANNVYFIGHSLGAIDGIPFVAINNDPSVQASPFSDLPFIKAGAFLNTGSAPPTLLTNSGSYSPTILGGLSAASSELEQGKSGLESYLSVFQGLLDSVDPINFASSLSDPRSSTGILLTEIIGDGTASAPRDQTIPNAAHEMWGVAPLGNNLPSVFAGTEPLINQFGAVKTADASSDGDAAVIVTRFTEGSHSNPVSAGNTVVDTYSSAAVFAEMVAEIVSFFAWEGDVPASIVQDTEVVEP